MHSGNGSCDVPVCIHISVTSSHSQNPELFIYRNNFLRQCLEEKVVKRKMFWKTRPSPLDTSTSLVNDLRSSSELETEVKSSTREFRACFWSISMKVLSHPDIDKKPCSLTTVKMACWELKWTQFCRASSYALWVNVCAYEIGLLLCCFDLA